MDKYSQIQNNIIVLPLRGPIFQSYMVIINPPETDILLALLPI